MTKLKIFIAITIVVLILIICNIYVESKINNKVKSGIGTNTYLSITTTPTRIAKIQPVIDSFIEQSYKPTSILVNIPNISYKGIKYDIPAWMTNYHNQGLIKIVNVEEDYGPGTKLYGALKVADKPDDIIVVADDDTIYPKKWFENILTYCEQYPKNAVTYLKWKHGDIDVCQGYMGFAVRKKMVSTGILDFPHESCKRGDDFWISAHLNKNNVPVKHIVPHSLSAFMLMKCKHIGVSPEAKGSNSNNDENYNLCSKYL